jgi:hypothetical protein
LQMRRSRQQKPANNIKHWRMKIRAPAELPPDCRRNQAPRNLRRLRQRENWWRWQRQCFQQLVLQQCGQRISAERTTAKTFWRRAPSLVAAPYIGLSSILVARGVGYVQVFAGESNFVNRVALLPQNAM